MGHPRVAPMGHQGTFDFDFAIQSITGRSGKTSTGENRIMVH